jgi:hypothetical protein
MIRDGGEADVLACSFATRTTSPHRHEIANLFYVGGAPCIALTRFVSSSQCGDMVGEFSPWHCFQVTMGRCYDSQYRLDWCVKSEVPKENIPVA